MITPRQIPPELIRAGTAGSLLVLVGAGAAAGSGLPGGNELLERLLAAARADAGPEAQVGLDGAESWFAAGGDEDRVDKLWLLREVMGDSWVRSAITGILGAAAATPTALHRALAELSGATFATTNVDGLLEEALRERSGRAPRLEITPEGQAGAPAPGDVLKLGGDVKRPELIALPGRAPAGAGTLSAWRARLATLRGPSWEVLLVGYEARDPVLSNVVDALRGDGQGALAGAFWLVAEGVRGRARAFSLGLRPVWLRANEEAPGWVKALGDAIRRERAQGPAVVLAGPEDEDALHRCEQALAEAEHHVEVAPEDAAPQAAAARCRLDLGIGLLNLGRSAEARELLVRIADSEAGLLTVEGRVLLAEGLVQLGEIGRARAAMPDKGGEPEGSAVAAAWQLIDAMEGRLPEGNALSPVVELHGCRLLVRKARLDEAAARLLRLLVEARAHAALTIHALGALEEALHGTVFEQPEGATPIPIERRAEVIAVLEEGLRRLDASPLPSEAQRRRDQIRWDFIQLTEDDDRRAAAQGPLVARGAVDATAPRRGALLDALALDRAEALAARGKHDEALALLPTSDHPWLSRFSRLRLLVAARRLAEALPEALDLAGKWPGRAPIEALAAKLLHLGRRPEALEHARRAFEALPGRGHRWLLGVCLLAGGHAAEAWDVLEPLGDEVTPDVFAARAQAAEAVCIEAAPALLEQYLAARPDDAAARLRLAIVEAKLGKTQRARELSWAAATGPGNERLAVDRLYACAVLQRVSETPDDLARERIRTIAELLETRFRTEGEPYRLALLAALDGTLDAADVHLDMDLLQSHGLVFEVHSDEGDSIAREDLDEQLAAQQGYREGLIGFDSLSELLRTPAATVFSQALRGDPFSLSLAVGSGAEKAPLLDLKGARVLTGTLELFLIHHLGLWDSLRQALGEGGKLVIFEDVLSSIDGATRHAADEQSSTAATQEGAVNAVKLGTSLRQALDAAAAEGWLDARSTRPAVADLPDLRAALNNPWNRRLTRAPLETALAYRTALEGDASLSLLTADAFTASVAIDRAALVLAWPSPDSAQKCSRRMHSLDSRLIFLPALVRGLAPAPDGIRLRANLASLGFADALEVADVIELVRRHGRADHPEITRILDGHERLARSAVRRVARVAQVRVAWLYASAIWAAWCGALPEEDAQALLADLLGRAERIDTARGSAVVDTLLSVLVELAAQDPERAQDPHDAKVYPSLLSPAGRLWTRLAAWSGPGGPRRAAFDQALRYVWRMLDVRSGEDPGASRTARALLLSCHGGGRALDRGMEPIAILSGCWRTRLLNDVFAGLADMRSGEAQQVPFETILCHGAKLLNDVSGPSIDNVDMQFRFSFPVPGTPFHVPVSVPIEAVLLRAGAEAQSRVARELAAAQGPSDGRAYARLERLADQPDDEERRRAYARFTVVAPWRLVRETPRLLASWHAIRRVTLPRFVSDLREMLSEPPGPLRAETFFWHVLNERSTAGGFWAERRDGGGLLAQAALVPGLLPSFLTQIKLRQREDGYPALIAEALYRLDHPHDHPAAALAEAIFFLRGAAAQKPFVRLAEGEIDLRERLPERLVAVLRAVREPPPSGTLADAEAGLLRLSGRIVRGLADGQDLPLRDRLWLTYRLYQWVCAQLDRLPAGERVAWIQAVPAAEPTLDPDDLLDPEGFDRERGVDHRLITILCALHHVEAIAMVPGGPPPRSVSSTQIEKELAELASRSWTDMDRSFRPLGGAASVLDWSAPAAVPDLALLALLSLRNEAFFTLTPEARLRWILDLPRRITEMTRAPWSIAERVLEALVASPARMSAEEARAFGAWLRGLEEPTGAEEPAAATAAESGSAAAATTDSTKGSSLVRTWRWRGLTALFVRGDPALEAEVRALLLEHLSSPEAQLMFGKYLSGVAHHAPERLQAEAERILAAAATAGVDAVDLLPSVGHVILIAEPPGVRAAVAALRALADRPPFRDDPRTQKLLVSLGLR